VDKLLQKQTKEAEKHAAALAKKPTLLADIEVRPRQPSPAPAPAPSRHGPTRIPTTMHPWQAEIEARKGEARALLQEEGANLGEELAKQLQLF
jgi:hypothetical protein